MPKSNKSQNKRRKVEPRLFDLQAFWGVLQGSTSGSGQISYLSIPANYNCGCGILPIGDTDSAYYDIESYLDGQAYSGGHYTQNLRAKNFLIQGELRTESSFAVGNHLPQAWELSIYQVTCTKESIPPTNEYAHAYYGGATQRDNIAAALISNANGANGQEVLDITRIGGSRASPKNSVVLGGFGSTYPSSFTEYREYPFRARVVVTGPDVMRSTIAYSSAGVSDPERKATQLWYLVRCAVASPSNGTPYAYAIIGKETMRVFVDVDEAGLKSAQS